MPVQVDDCSLITTEHALEAVMIAPCDCRPPEGILKNGVVIGGRNQRTGLPQGTQLVSQRGISDLKIPYSLA